jgi:hypothetical protein
MRLLLRPLHPWGSTLRPCGSILRSSVSLRPCGSTPRPCGSALNSSPLWLNSSPVWLASPSPGRRRAVPTSHWPWVSSRAARRRTATGRSPTAPCTLRVWRPVVPAYARARSAGRSPWSCGADSGGSPASRCFAGLWDTGLSAACQPAQHHCGCALGQVGIQPEPDPLGTSHA